MIDIKFIIKDYLKCKSFQEFINNRFWDTNKMVIPKLWMKIASYDGKTFFYWDDMIITLETVRKDYQYDDIRKTDIVLDIGGGIGAYSLQICNDVTHCYVVEPVTDERIRRNIKLTNQFNNNNVHNVTVFKCALSSEKGLIEIEFHDGIATVPCYSLTQLKSMCGGHVDVLKIDCEGAEWDIKPHELDGIRRIEMEIHDFDQSKGFMNYINMLKNAGFDCKYNILDKRTTLAHAVRIK